MEGLAGGGEGRVAAEGLLKCRRTPRACKESYGVCDPSVGLGARSKSLGGQKLDLGGRKRRRGSLAVADPVGLGERASVLRKS